MSGENVLYCLWVCVCVCSSRGELRKRKISLKGMYIHMRVCLEGRLQWCCTTGFNFWSEGHMAPFVPHSPSITRRRPLIILKAVTPIYTWRGCNVCHARAHTHTYREREIEPLDEQQTNRIFCFQLWNSWQGKKRRSLCSNTHTHTHTHTLLDLDS